LAGVLVGAASAAMNLGPAHNTASTADTVAANLSGSPSASRSTDDRASRSGLRALPTPVPARSSAKPKASSTPSTKKATPTPPSSGGTVTSSGSCGASFYSDGQKTANGETFDPNAFTAANKTLPFNTRVKITNKANGESVTVRVNDRGPFVAGRCFDLSRAAFAAISSLGAGVITINYQVLS
jgi:rare lipoprotein A